MSPFSACSGRSPISQCEIVRFQGRLRPFLDLHLELVVHENRSTMLNLLQKTGTTARLSVHKMFLQAPDLVLSAIAHYVRGNRKERQTRNRVLRQYIQEHLAQEDYTHLINPQKLIQQGEYFNLQTFYDALNQKYFSEKLLLSMTWYGEKRRRRGSRITFGQYVSGLRLIKIHKMLDDPFFPDYFVAFVIYHEMLHSVVPGSLDSRGRFCFHGREFKEREMAFEEYGKAILWEKKNKADLFNYGRTQ